MEKEFLYVGYYVDTEGNTILKIGTTNNLERRQKEHTKNYRNASKYTMPKDENFTFIWHLPLSKYNTLRYEDRNREEWKNLEIGKFIRNDRFILEKPISQIPVKIKKTYQVSLDEILNFQMTEDMKTNKLIRCILDTLKANPKKSFKPKEITIAISDSVDVTYQRVSRILQKMDNVQKLNNGSYQII